MSIRPSGYKVAPLHVTVSGTVNRTFPPSFPVMADPVTGSIQENR